MTFNEYYIDKYFKISICIYQFAFIFQNKSLGNKLSRNFNDIRNSYQLSFWLEIGA